MNSVKITINKKSWQEGRLFVLGRVERDWFFSSRLNLRHLEPANQE
jgi:hypothetical protein